MFPPGVSTTLLVLLALIAVGAWVGMHLLTKRLAFSQKRLIALLFAARVAVGFGATLAIIQAAMRTVLFATNWPLWPIALAASVGVETLLSLYRLERKSLPGKWGYLITAIRMTLLLLLACMLVQPVLSSERVEKNRRVVAVLVDRSQSMRINDAQMTPWEKLRLSEMLSARSAPRPYRLEVCWKGLEKVRQNLASQGDWLAQLAPVKAEIRAGQLAGQAEEMTKILTEARKSVEAQIDAINEPINGKVKIDDKTRAALMDVKANLSRQVRDNLAEALKIIDPKNPQRMADQCQRLLELVRSSATALSAIDPKVDSLGMALDEAFYASLDAAQRKGIDELARQTRLALAKEVLTHRQEANNAADKPAPSLLDKIGEKYQVKLYAFASDAGEISPGALDKLAASQPAWATSGPAANSKVPDEQSTDIGAAMQKAMSEVPTGLLAGVILLTDGRHNGPTPVETIAVKLAQQQVPVCSIVMGASRPPCDAAVVSVQAPAQATPAACAAAVQAPIQNP